MSAFNLLIPVSLAFGLLGLASFFWSLAKGQYDDPKGDAERILFPHDKPL